MSFATRAIDLCPVHTEGDVSMQGDIFFGDGLIETRPTGSGLKLRLRIEERCSTTDTIVYSVGMTTRVFTRESALRALAPRHFELLRRQLLAPFRIALFDFVHDFHSNAPPS